MQINRQTMAGIFLKVCNVLQWYAPSHIARPSPPLPTTVEENTINAAHRFLKGRISQLDECCDPANFRSFTLWNAYWVISKAADAAARKAGGREKEDFCSIALVDTLRSESELHHLEFAKWNIDVALGHVALFRYAKPAIQEVDFGADMLIVMAGPELVGSDAAKLFWVQAKMAPDGNPCRLKFHQPNSRHVTQLRALQTTEHPANGSHALYALYARTSPYVLSVEVRHVESMVRDTPSAKFMDICPVAVRFQEHILSLALAPTGHMGTPKAVVDFIAARKAEGVVPLQIATVAGGREGGPGQVFLRRLQEMLGADFQRQEEASSDSAPEVSEADSAEWPKPGQG